MQEVTVGIGGAAGDGLDRSGDTLAKTAGRLGLHVYAYNSYQSIIRGGHIWLRVRMGENKTYSHGDRLSVLVALNQDTIERHAGTVDEGGCIIFNSDKFKCAAQLISKSGVVVLGLPIGEVTAEVAKKHGAIQPIMQNTVMIGAVLAVTGLDFNEAAAVLKETFAHKGDKIIDLNVSLLEAGYSWAKASAQPITAGWQFNLKRRPFCTGNEAIALGAVAAGCKFYSAYPMTPASGILHWMAAHAEKAGVCVKQAEDELAVINMAVGAGLAGVRSMCATSGGGFALMTEAVGMAGIMEVPLVCVEVQRGGPSTGLPTKTEQADLNQVFGASQGDFPRLIVAPRDVADCFNTAVEAFNLAERYQMPVLLMSDLLLSEHPETVDKETFTHVVKIDRGQSHLTEWQAGKTYKRFSFETENGVSPRVIPGTANAIYTSGSDDHDERGILISDMFTSPGVRRKMVEKRQQKLDHLLKELKAPVLEGPAESDVTLVTWGSTYGAVKEAADILNQSGIKTNFVVAKYILPFHAREWKELLGKCKKLISVEVNYTSQFAHYLRAQTGIGMQAHINRYDGEPMEPLYIVERVKQSLMGKLANRSVTEPEARDIAYHYLRTHYAEKLRPSKIAKEGGAGGKGEPVWHIELVDRTSGGKQAELEIGAETGATYSFKQVGEPVKA